MDKSIQGKWVAEVYDLLRLFHFVGRSVAGLLLVLVLWSAFVTLAVKPLISTGEPPGVWNPLEEWTGVDRLMSIWLVGTVLILLWWGCWSGAATGPALWLGRVTLLGAILVVRILLILRLLLFAIVTLPIESWRIRRWRRSL